MSCVFISCQFIKAIHSSYYIEITIPSQFKGCSLFVTFQRLSFITGVLSRKGKAMNNSTCMLNSFGGGDLI